MQHSPPDETNNTKEEVKLNDRVGGGLRDALVSGTQQIQTFAFTLHARYLTCIV